MSNRRKHNHTSRKVESAAKFRRAIHSTSNPRVGLSAAREAVDLCDIRRIVEELGRHSIYKILFAGLSFPKELSSFTGRPRLTNISPEGEICWTASVLLLFKERLAAFVTRRTRFEELFASADWAAASELLDEVERDFGISIWLITNRIQILQLKDGLQAQKHYLEEIVATGSLNEFVRWLAYYVSLRSEENVSFSKLESDTADLMRGGALTEYVIRHIVPYHLSKIENEGNPINWEEPNPLIDRLETLIKMLQLYVAKRGAAVSREVREAIERLSEIGDARLGNLRALLEGRLPISSVSHIVEASDAYTEGRYPEVLKHSGNFPELQARATLLHAGHGTAPASSAKSVIERARDLMVESLSLTPDQGQAVAQLRKLAITCSGHPLGITIAAFLERDQDHARMQNYTVLDRLAAIDGDLTNPWNAPILGSLLEDVDWLDLLLSRYPLSAALKLQRYLRCGNGFASELDRLPKYRRYSYLGHHAFNHGELEAAAGYYREATQSENDYVRSRALRHLYETEFSAGNIKECLELVVGHTVENPNAAHFYPLEQLAKSCLKDPALGGDVSLAILLYLAARYVHPRFERELSDVYENVLADVGVERPVQLCELKSPPFDPAKLILFLRYVCTSRILDSSTAFECPEEIDAERIGVCQHLLKIDPQNRASYLSEIRAITRDANVADLLHKMQSSKIYVDEAGIRTITEPTLRESYARYLELLRTPTLAYQAEKLSKMLEDLLSAKGNHPEFRDLRLPASEQEGLFKTMQEELMEAFAFNPAYGLDTHLSTSIRHGAFEGHLRSPFAIEELLAKKEKRREKDKGYVMPSIWQRRLDHLSDEDIEHVQKQLARFTQKFDELIQSYLKEKLHVRMFGGSSLMLFVMDTPHNDLLDLQREISTGMEFEDFFDRLVAQCWLAVDRSLEVVRHDIQDVLGHQVLLALKQLATSVESRIAHDRVAPLIDAIARARTKFQSVLADVIEWFRRPDDMAREPFDLEVAIHVALRQVNNCYVKTPVQLKLSIEPRVYLPGELLDGVCEILFILLQNVVLHSGYEDQSIPVEVTVTHVDGVLVVRAENRLAPSICIETRRQLAQDAMRRYEGASALTLARKEGGSGLSKVWRIAEFDLRKKHEIRLDVSDDKKFTSSLAITVDGVSA